MDHYQLFINGEFVDAENGETFESIDPGTTLPFATVAKAGRAEAEQAIDAARRAFDNGAWSGLSPTARAEIIYDFADQIGQQALRMALIESMDAGQVIRFAKFNGLLAWQLLRNLAHYAATRFPWEEEIPYAGNAFAPGRDFIRREPIGVCVGIVPWNFPAIMASWKVAQSIVMGNTVVLKPATSTSLSALIIAEAAKAAGIPNGVLNVLPGPGGELGKILCTHPSVDKIAFTGSTEVGRTIMKMAADSIKKVTLELGGKSANIILDDADMEFAVNGAVYGTFFHQGQVCESGTRVLVSSKIYDEFIDKMRKRAESLRVGYQLDPMSHLGPLVNETQLATVEKYVKLGREEGAEVLTGGHRVEVEGFNGGYYYAPTIFVNVKNSMRIAQEEIFGPVVSVIKFDGDEEAAAIANDSIYGLGGGVFSSNTARAERLARQMRTGTVWINNYHSFGDFCPFGGYKQSGVGRELGESGLAEYTQIKRIHVNSYAAVESNFNMSVFGDDPKIGFAQYINPTNIISGHGCLPAICKEVVNLGCRRALIMTDPGVRKAGLTQLVQDALADFCVGVFDNIAQDTDLETVDSATALARELKADCIVSVGGGSVIDTAKSVCVTLKNGGRANDYLAFFRLQGPQIPHIVIPTTSGTGSEVTSVAVIKSKKAGRKVFILDTFITPNTAILDPRFTMTLPPSLTASTAMDAMTHAIEALTSGRAQAICDGQALQAIRMINENLPLVMIDGRNEKARSNLQMAATMAGMAFNIAGVGLAHAMAHTVGALHNVPHGTACGIILPKVMRFNVDFATDKLKLAASALGINTAGMDDRAAALAAADEIESLMKKTGHPMGLRDVGVPEESLPLCGFHAIVDAAGMTNPRPVNDPQEIIDIYQQAY